MIKTNTKRRRRRNWGKIDLGDWIEGSVENRWKLGLGFGREREREVVVF